MPDRSSVKLMARSRRLLWTRRGDVVIEWWFAQREYGKWAVGPPRAFKSPGGAGPSRKGDAELFWMPKKPDGAIQTNAKLVGADPGLWGKSLPAIADWLCPAQWDTGEPLGKTRLSMWRAGAEIVVALQVADLGGVRVEARAESPQNALMALEELLKLPAVPWQLDPYPIGQTARKKK